MDSIQEHLALNHEQLRESGNELNKLLLRKEDLKQKHRSSIATQQQWMLWGIYILLVIPILITGLIRTLQKLEGETNPRGTIIIFGNVVSMGQVWLVLFFLTVVFMTLWMLTLRSGVRGIERELTDVENELEAAYMISSDLRLKYFHRMSARLTSKSVRIDWVDIKRRKKSEELRMLVGDAVAIFGKMALPDFEKSPAQKLPDWDDVQFMLTQWDELLQDEERELIGERYWKIGSIGIALIYLILLVLARPYFDTVKDVFGVPFPIVIWSAVGSFAAILYRFYKSPRRINLEVEIRWLIARPIIGVVMGTLAYFALLSGLIIFGGSSGEVETTNQYEAAKIQFWIIAFLAGFSDKFYEKVIELLVGKFGAGESEHYVEKTESTVEITTEKE